MESLISALPAPMLRALGWALIQFLWQGVGIAAFAAIAMSFCRRTTTRYAIGVLALGLMLAAPVLTVFAGPVPANRFAFAVPGLPLKLLVEIWAAGVLLLGLRFALGLAAIGWRIGTRARPAAPRLVALCQQMQQRLGISRAIRFLECDWLEAPAGFGALRPVLLFPITGLLGLSENQLAAVIAHELAHIRRHDFAVNLLQVLAETLLFYHPAIWWLNRRIRAEREICCDEIAMAACGNPTEYARALALLARHKQAPVVAMAANHGLLTDRVLRLIRPTSVPVRPRAAMLAASLLLLAVSLAAVPVLTPVLVPVLHRAAPVIAQERLEQVASILPVARQHRIVPARLRPALPRLLFPVLPDTDTQISVPDAAAIIPVSNISPPQSASAAPVAITETYYPARALGIMAPHSAFEMERTEAGNYCDRYAQQTVLEGASKPMLVDTAAKGRYAFFYWHCMLRNGEMTLDAGPPDAPNYTPLGNASADHPVHAAGAWAIAYAPFPANSGCTFTQTGNSIAGTCSHGPETGAVQGVVDGRQLRWRWSYRDDEQRQVEMDFIGMIGPDGSLRGQSIALQQAGIIRIIQSFTATPGPVVTQVASE